jgi:Ser/Thr protein kinase RdoA (MazF antagonist)
LSTINAILGKLLKENPKRVISLDSNNNNVFKVETNRAVYILKCFEERGYGAFNREFGMRACLQQFSDIRFPSIIRELEWGKNRYILMEYVPGTRLDKIWNKEAGQIREQMNSLGEMLGMLHEIPVSEGKQFLEREEVLYTEEYFLWMLDTIAPYLRGKKSASLLEMCYDLVTSSSCEEVIIHGDFGPHQVVVGLDREWVLMDFEYAGLGAAVDDLTGTEIRLEQKGYAGRERFLAGYERIRGSSAGEGKIKTGYKVYNLLAMLTYDLAHRMKKPSIREVERLVELLTDL